MEALISFSCTIFMILFGYFLIKVELKAIRNKVKPIGTYIPIMYLILGIIGFLGGIAIFIRLILKYIFKI